MGNACCGKRKEKKNIVLILVGLDNAGKTVAAKGLAGESTDDVIPTVGFHAIKLNYKNFIVKVYDLGGAANFRGIWPKYFVDAYGIIFVIDSSDINRLDEAKQVLESVLSHEKVSGKPLLFLANKQDNENALDEIDLHENLNLEAMVNKYHCPTLVECCSAKYADRHHKIDPGIVKGFSWLMNFIVNNYVSISTRVIADVSQQEETERIQRNAIIRRINEARRLEESNDVNAIQLYSEYAENTNVKSVNMKNGSWLIPSIENSSEEEFPPVYYGTVQKQNIIERPNSAREFVRNQLQLSCNGNTSLKSNKTFPVHLLGLKLPSSAKERSRTCVVRKRILKSAGDISASTHLPNMVFPKEKDCQALEMHICSTKDSFLPFDIRPKINIQNGKAWNNSEDENEINFVSD